MRLYFTLIALCVSAMVYPVPVHSQTFTDPITNNTVEQMVRRGMPVAEVVKAIRTAPEVDFLITRQEAYELATAGATDTAIDRILDAMRQRFKAGKPLTGPIPAEVFAPSPMPVTPGVPTIGPAGLGANANGGQSCSGVEAALESVHSRSIIESFPEQLYAGAARSAASSMSPRQHAFLNPVMKRAFYSAFEPNSVNAELVVAFHRRCSQEMLSALQALGRNNLYMAMDQRESVMFRPEYAAERQAFLATLQRQRPSAARLALIHRIDKAGGSTEMMMDLMDAVDRGMRGAGLSSNAATLRAAKQMTAKQILETLLFIYRQVKDGELESYAELLESPPVRQFSHAFTTALSEVLQHRMMLAVQQMMQEIKTATLTRG